MPFGTTLAVMSLVERGKIALDAPLSRYLPEFRASSFSQVTIRRMLTHTAGFPAIPGNGALASGFPKAAKLLAAKAPVGDYTRAHLLESRARIKRAMDAGRDVPERPAGGQAVATP